MTVLVRSERFSEWLKGLRDRRARAKVQTRLDRLVRGNPGDVRPVGNGLSEMRIDHGPGYRVYYIKYGPLIIVALGGGDKSTQDSDIEQARVAARDWINRSN